MDNKMPLNKSNLFNKVFVHWTNHPERFLDDSSFADVLSDMLGPGEDSSPSRYCLSATLLMNHQGQMRRAAAEAYFKIIRGGVATAKDVESIVYIPEYGDNWRRVHTDSFFGRERYYHGRDTEVTPVRVPPPAARQHVTEEFVSLDSVESAVDVEPPAPEGEAATPPTQHAEAGGSGVAWSMAGGAPPADDDSDEESSPAVPACWEGTTYGGILRIAREGNGKGKTRM